MDRAPELTQSDQEILEAIARGDLRRFGVLVDRHKGRAMTLALRIVGDREEAEELVQDAFLRAFNGLGQFRRESRFSTWLYKIVYNLCIAHVQRRPRNRQMLNVGDEEGFDAASLDMEDPSAQQVLEDEEVQELLQEELHRLPETFRTALTLFYVQELSYDEIASFLQMPLGTVKTNLSRGRILLRKRIVERLREGVNAA